MKVHGLKRRRDAVGWLFILPWFIGLIVFFIQPLVSFLHYSFTEFTFDELQGYVLNPAEGGIFGQYKHALLEDAKYPVLVFQVFRDLLYQTPIVVFLSLFTAVILNQKFRGKTAMRLIFFLPVIVTSGVISTIIRQDMNSVANASVSASSNIFDVTLLIRFLQESGLPEQMVNLLSGLVANVADLVWKSGIQIMIFMAALLSIPPAYYEVAQVEGATGWETFWMITFPIVSPFVLANTIYTIIDSFTNFGNGVIEYITEYAVMDMKYSYAAAMAWLYFLMVLAVIGLIALLFKRVVYYTNQP